MRTIAYREALREAMSEEMRRDERVFLMGEEVAEEAPEISEKQKRMMEIARKLGSRVK